MEELGYPLTWITKCFINGGCSAKVFAHTNGDGDFVLLDSLGPPWPIHECYLYRVPNDGGPGRPAREWVEVRPASPDAPLPKSGLDVVGTVTDYEEAKLGSVRGFRDLPKQAQEEVRRRLGDRRSIVRIVSGDGLEYVVFADLRNVVVGVGDVVGARLKVISILSSNVFVASQVVRLLERAPRRKR